MIYKQFKKALLKFYPKITLSTVWERSKSGLDKYEQVTVAQGRGVVALRGFNVAYMYQGIGLKLGIM